MASLTQYLNEHHLIGDALFTQMERAAQAGEWAACMRAAEDYLAFMEAHFLAEEGILIPPILAAHPRSKALLTALEDEHRVMRVLLRELVQTAESACPEAFFATADGLLILMQQHYLKEEHSFYPLCDHPALDQTALLAQLKRGLEPRD